MAQSLAGTIVNKITNFLHLLGKDPFSLFLGFNSLLGMKCLTVIRTLTWSWLYQGGKPKLLR